MALFFALGRFLAAFCNSCCVCCRSWPVLVGPGTLRARFWRVPGGSGEGLGGPKTVFCDAFWRLQSCNAKPARKAFRIGKTNTKLGFLHIARNAPTSKNDAKSFQKPFAQHFPKKACSKLVSGLGRLAFGGVWGTSWQAFGRSWASLGSPWALLRRLLAASWALLGVSWLVWVVSGVNFNSPGRPGPRFWSVWWRDGLGFPGLWGHVLACLVLRLALHNTML